MNSNHVKKIYAVGLFAILLTTYAYLSPAAPLDGVSKTRAAIAFAIINEGHLYIDNYKDEALDKAFYQGHYYTSMSIGPSLIGSPGYLFVKAVFSLPIFGDFSPYLIQLIGTMAMTLLAASIPSALLAVVLFLFTCRFTKNAFLAFLLSLIYGFATIAFSYSNLLFQHQLAAFGVFLGFYILWRYVFEKIDLRWLWVVGALFGISVLSEYTMALFVAIIFLWAFYKLPNRFDLFRVIIAAIPFGSLQLIYNAIAFGNPLSFGYAYSLVWGDVGHSHGLLGIGLPSIPILFELMFGTFRGLFFISPVLLLSVPGFYFMWKNRPDQRSVVFLFVAVIVTFFLYNSGYMIWWGGGSIGPRYLTGAIPFLCVPVIFLIDKKALWTRLLIAALVIISVTNVWIQTIAEGISPETNFTPAQEALITLDSSKYGSIVLTNFEEGNYFRNPLFEYALPYVSNGQIDPNFGTILTLQGFWSFIPLIVIIIAEICILIRYIRRAEAKTQPITA